MAQIWTGTGIIGAALLTLFASPATAQTVIYPEGTDCANLPTISARLLCGRQQYRREHGLVMPPDYGPAAPATNDPSRTPPPATDPDGQPAPIIVPPLPDDGVTQPQ